MYTNVGHITFVFAFSVGRIIRTSSTRMMSSFFVLSATHQNCFLGTRESNALGLWNTIMWNSVHHSAPISGSKRQPSNELEIYKDGFSPRDSNGSSSHRLISSKCTALRAFHWWYWYIWCQSSHSVSLCILHIKASQNITKLSMKRTPCKKRKTSNLPFSVHQFW